MGTVLTEKNLLLAPVSSMRGRGEAGAYRVYLVRHGGDLLPHALMAKRQWRMGRDQEMVEEQQILQRRRGMRRRGCYHLRDAAQHRRQRRGRRVSTLQTETATPPTRRQLFRALDVSTLATGAPLSRFPVALPWNRSATDYHARCRLFLLPVHVSGGTHTGIHKPPSMSRFLTLWRPVQSEDGGSGPKLHSFERLGASQRRREFLNCCAAPLIEARNASSWNPNGQEG